MPRKATPRSSPAATSAQTTATAENPCQDCEGSGSVAHSARNVKVKGQTAICLTCLGSGEAT